MIRLRLVSYNIHKGVGVDRKYRLDRIADVVRHYDPDVVCLQEVLWKPVADGERTQPQELADALGLPHRVIALNCHRRMGTYGNMTLSRFPLEEVENLDLSLRFQKPRAALYTRIKLRGTSLHVFNAHLGLAGFERVRQMHSLIEETERLAPEPEPVLYAGDMNDWRHRIFPGVLEKAGFRCAVGDKDDPGHATYPSWYPVGALDKVFVKGGVSAVRAFPSRLAVARVASDHLPLIAELVVSA